MARVIVKVGSSSLTSELGVVDTAMIENLCRQVEAVRADGHQVVVVSSGAVAAGVAALGLQQRPTDLPTLQALAALGQPRMIETWIRSLAGRGAVAAQVLLVPHDFVNRRQYLHAAPDPRAPAGAGLRPGGQRERRHRRRPDPFR